MLFAAAFAVAVPASATTMAVTDLSSAVPAGTSFGSLPGENSAGSTTEISSTTALDANGSLHIAGDRTRVQTGVQYAPYTTNLGITADQLISLTGDYVVNNGGTGGIQSPAFRLYLNTDAGARTELIWEAAYNGGYTLGAPDSVAATDVFWRYLAGCGAVIIGGGCGSGTYEMHTVAEWGALLGTDWFVSAFGVGDGSGAGAGFDAFADHLTLATNNEAFGTRTYDFQVAAAVPEPATWATMLLGFGLVGGAMRRRRKPLLAQAA